MGRNGACGQACLHRKGYDKSDFPFLFLILAADSIAAETIQQVQIIVSLPITAYERENSSSEYSFSPL